MNAESPTDLKVKRLPQAGFSLLEILVTILILAFGLLGLAGLQAKIQVSENESFQRAQAILILQDMANRLSANRINSASYLTTTPLGTGDTQPNSCTALSGALQDRCEWSRTIKGASERQSGTSASIGAMVDGRGCVEQINTNPPTYRISVAWQGMSPLKAPSLSCGQNLYGAENLRRTIGTVVTVGNLL